MAQNGKVRDLLVKDVEEEIPIYTCFSSYEFDFLFEDTTSISISELLSKERPIASHVNPKMSRIVMQLQ